MNVCKLIDELIEYGKQNGLVESEDSVYIRNRLLELMGEQGYTKSQAPELQRPIHEILDGLTALALEKGLISEDTVAQKDLFDTKIMGAVTPPPSVVRKSFWDKYRISPKEATDWYYSLAKSTNYIRADRIEKDEKWTVQTPYGEIDITINLSKPEKDPRDIAKAGACAPSGYPSCLLCVENEGYSGHLNHPARQNHRLIPVTLGKEQYYLQYSPYVYYNEHCIVLNEKHIPMVINKETFVKLLDFTTLFPHYTVGSNADLPIVGGSILSHDHFQGGSYEFAMAKAPVEKTFSMAKYSSVKAGVVKWPMSVVRLWGTNADEIAMAANHILQEWKNYTDKEAFIFSHTEKVPHNTLTPIARQKDGVFELDLVLRNNITTKEHPMGVYHPHEEYHHIKKENIGLIEVMGLAVLPARLKKEMALLKAAILRGESLRDNEVLLKHADWAEEWLAKRAVTAENIDKTVEEEIGKVFVKVLECSGVFKRTEQGAEAFERFINVIK